MTSTLRKRAPHGLRVGLGEALREGIVDLKRSGYEVRLPSGGEELEAPLTEDVDLASGRIIQEALHNAAKHGVPPGPVVVAVERTEDSLDLVITNPARRDAEHPPDATGLDVIRRHAEVLGGGASFKCSEGVWLCAVTLPLRNEGNG